MYRNQLFMLVLVALCACKQEYVENPKPLPTVPAAHVEKLEPVEAPLPIIGSGRVEVLEYAALSFKTGGIVRQVAVDAGQQVQKGQVLASLDLVEINAQVQQARAQVTQLERDLARFNRLYKDSAATLQQLEGIQTALDVAEANLTIATFNQTHSQIIAPATGVVLQKMVEENELVSPGQPVFSLSTKAAGMSLNVGLSDRDVVRVALGDSAVVTLDAYPGEEVMALVTEIAANAHPRVGTYQVKLMLEPFPKPIKNGFFARTRILPANQPAYYKIPMEALVGGTQGEAAIYTAKANKTVHTTFQPLYFGDDFIAARVTDLPYASVVTEGAAYLQNDMVFEPKND